MSITVSPVSLEKGLKALFVRAMLEAPSYLEQIATEVPSDSNLETYAWLGQIPRMREFLSERQIQGFLDTKYVVTNKEWEQTIGVRQRDLDDDKLGGYAIRISEMGAEARAHPQSLMVDALINGTSATLGLCYDGGAFFTATHPARGSSGVQSNIVTGTGTTTAQLEADFQTAKTRMMRFLDEGGRVFRRSFGQLIVCCPPELELVFLKLLTATQLANDTNVNVGRARVIVMPELVDTNDWYLLHVGGVVKPLVLQMRKPAVFESQGEGSGDTFFNKRVHLFGAYARYVQAYGMWQDAVKITNT